MAEQIEQLMRQVKLGGMAKGWRSVPYENTEQYVTDLLTLELQEREANRINRMVKTAGFRVRPGFFLTNGAVLVPGGVSFTIHSVYATGCELCLFRRGETEPFAVLPFPQDCRVGHTYSMIVFDLDIDEIEYAYRVDGPYDPDRGLIFDKSRYLLDPYARAVTGQSVWGSRNPAGSAYHARVVKDTFDWAGFVNHRVPFQDMVIYEMHVRGFTRHESSGVKNPGTFAGLLGQYQTTIPENQ